MTVYALLREALRRYTRFHFQVLDSEGSHAEPLTEAWTGLGFKTDYLPALKAGYMEYVHGPLYRAPRWYRLTAKGAAIVQAWLDQGFTYEDVEASKPLPWPADRPTAS